MRVGRTPRRCTWGASSAATWRPMWPSPMTTTWGGWAAAAAGDWGVAGVADMAGHSAQTRRMGSVLRAKDAADAGGSVCERGVREGVERERLWWRERVHAQRVSQRKKKSLGVLFFFVCVCVKDLRRSSYAKTSQRQLEMFPFSPISSLVVCLLTKHLKTNKQERGCDV